MGKPVKLPLTGTYTSLCDVHRTPRFVAHMRSLIARG